MTMTTNETDTPKTRTFTYRTKSRACDNFGAVDYQTWETITPTADGLRILMVNRGTCEGDRVNDRHEKLWPLSDSKWSTVEEMMAKACEYRLTHGYTEVK